MKHGERGVSMVEVLVAISILAISGLAVTQSTIRSFATLNQSYRTSVASQIALDKIESFAQQDPSTIQTSSNESNNSVTHSGLQFLRSTSVAVNSDGSRTITVSVASQNGWPGSASLSTTLPLWGNS
jgi:prepilin-type N-terminal cleavage/methylation domain-containing protein